MIHGQLPHVADDDFDNNFGLDEALNNATADKAAAAPNSYGASPFHPGGGQQGYEGQRNSAQQQGFGGQQAGGAQPTSPGAQPPEILNCECSLQCSYIMAKTAKNDGRWFYRYDARHCKAGGAHAVVAHAVVAHAHIFPDLLIGLHTAI